MIEDEDKRLAKLAKLPKWAQSEIAILRRNLERLTGIIKQMSVGPEGSPIRWSYREAEGNIPAEACVTFRVGEGDETGTIDLRLSHGLLVVRADMDRGIADLAVCPEAANAIRLRLTRW